MTDFAADALTGTVLTRVGLSGLKPLPCAQMLAIFGYAMVSCLFVNDAVKVALIKWRVPTYRRPSPSQSATVGDSVDWR